MRFLLQIGFCLIVLAAGVAVAKVGDDDKKETAKQEYKQTPFGKVAKTKAAAPPAVTKKKSNIAVSVDGDSITFSRPTPFGAQRWTRKRDALNSHEKQWLSDYESASAAKESASSEKPQP
jgi:hypothetical protein